jgi:hypothetical protein
MQELHWNLSWTLALVALCWVALSSLIALGLGQIIKRSKAPAQAPQQADGTSSAYADVAPTDDELQDLEASRWHSGTRLKPVRLDGAEEAERENRKVS